MEQYRQAVAQRVDGMKAMAQSLRDSTTAPPPVAQPQVPNAVIWSAAGPPSVQGPALPAPVASPYTNASFQAKDSELWNDWNGGTWDEPAP